MAADIFCAQVARTLLSTNLSVLQSDWICYVEYIVGSQHQNNCREDVRTLEQFLVVNKNDHTICRVYNLTTVSSVDHNTGINDTVRHRMMGLHKQKSSLLILNILMYQVNNPLKIYILLDQLSCGEQIEAAKFCRRLNPLSNANLTCLKIHLQ
jgi:hypothetical protein